MLFILMKDQLLLLYLLRLLREVVHLLLFLLGLGRQGYSNKVKFVVSNLDLHEFMWLLLPCFLQLLLLRINQLERPILLVLQLCRL